MVWFFGRWEIWRSVCCGNTVDGSEIRRSPVEMKNFSLFLRRFLYIPQVVQGFCSINSILRLPSLFFVKGNYHSSSEFLEVSSCFCEKFAAMFCFKEYFAVICAENVAD